MRALELMPVVLPTFAARHSIEVDDIEVKFSGNGDMDAAPLLGKFLADLHGEAQRLHAPTVRLCFRELYFLNSSCVKHFAALIGWNKRLVPALRYAIVFRTARSLTWQGRCLDELQQLDGDAVVIESVDSAKVVSSRVV